MIYKATGNLCAIQILLGHNKFENTVRYLWWCGCNTVLTLVNEPLRRCLSVQMVTRRNVDLKSCHRRVNQINDR